MPTGQHLLDRIDAPQGGDDVLKEITSLVYDVIVTGTSETTLSFQVWGSILFVPGSYPAPIVNSDVWLLGHRAAHDAGWTHDVNEVDISLPAGDP